MRARNLADEINSSRQNHSFSDKTCRKGTAKITHDYVTVALATVDLRQILPVLLSSVRVMFVDLLRYFLFHLLLFGCCLTSSAGLSLVSVPPTIVSEALSELPYRVREEVEIPCVASGDPPPT